MSTCISFHQLTKAAYTFAAGGGQESEQRMGYEPQRVCRHEPSVPFRQPAPFHHGHSARAGPRACHGAIPAHGHRIAKAMDRVPTEALSRPERAPGRFDWEMIVVILLHGHAVFARLVVLAFHAPLRSSHRHFERASSFLSGRG